MERREGAGTTRWKKRVPPNARAEKGAVITEDFFLQRATRAKGKRALTLLNGPNEKKGGQQGKKRILPEKTKKYYIGREKRGGVFQLVKRNKAEKDHANGERALKGNSWTESVLDRNGRR